MNAEVGQGALVVVLALLGGLLLGVVAFAAVRMLRRGGKPVKVAPATCIALRQDSEVRAGPTRAGSSTNYYATFELATGERMELAVRESDFGQLVEGDRGTLHWQGWFLRRFERTPDQ